jgi:hypothetical protein
VAAVKSEVIPLAILEVEKGKLPSVIAFERGQFLHYCFDAWPRAFQEVFNDYSA